MSKYTIGIDLGGTTMTAGIVNENYEIVGKLTWATRLPRPAEDLEKALADLCRTVAQDNKVDFADIKYVGIGTPGSVNFTTGFVGFNTNFGYYDWNLGPDLCEAQAPGKAQRSAFFRRLMQDLAYPAGTSTFWPACLPDPDAMPAPSAPAGGEDRPHYQPNADVFWSGVQALHARAVVVMGSVAARALGLPAGVRPLQQLRHRGTLVWVLWDVEFLLDEPQRYAAMLAFVRRALQQISRR